MTFPVAALWSMLKLSHLEAIFYQLSAFFWTVPPRKIKARAHCLLSKFVRSEKQDIFHAIFHQPELHEAAGQCAWCLGTAGNPQDQQDIIQPWSFYLYQHSAGEILSNDNTECWIRVISVFWQVVHKWFPQGGTYQSSENYHPSFISSSTSSISPSWYLGHCPLHDCWLPWH